jgi:tRNA threonylcarbamoyladenosine biosynthesis protein TsaE
MTVTYALDQLSDAARQLIQAAQNRSVWLFDGSMGAGKTTLIREICQQMGVSSPVQSPTFSIVNEYVTDGGEVIYHFDCYRLKTETEALDIGIEEYFDSGNYCFVEWPEKIASLLPDDCAHLKISPLPNGNREIQLIQ